MNLLHPSDLRLAYVMLRVMVGVNFFFHGLVRLPKLAGFAHHIAEGFEGTLMPVAMGHALAFVIPFAELVLGALLLVGLFTRGALVATLGLMIVLTAGVCLQENWPVAGSQLIYGGVLFVLLASVRANCFALDRVFGPGHADDPATPSD